MAWTTVLNRNNWPTGMHTFGPVDFPLGMTTIACRMARFEKLGNGKRKNGSEWPDLRDALNNQQDVVRYGAEVSFDGGITWEFIGGGTTAGGVYVASPGPGQPEEEIEWQMFELGGISQPDNPNRRIRGFMETFTPLGTIVEVEAR